mmetsp:Transcript_94796/g.225759  ORF Transcript_94796/g.225759 Transcript_94796/m.225759 type:complete len:263 (-) Transcript_94796:272-1060(-)
MKVGNLHRKAWHFHAKDLHSFLGRCGADPGFFRGGLALHSFLCRHRWGPGDLAPSGRRGRRGLFLPRSSCRRGLLRQNGAGHLLLGRFRGMKRLPDQEASVRTKHLVGEGLASRQLRDASAEGGHCQVDGFLRQLGVGQDGLESLLRRLPLWQLSRVGAEDEVGELLAAAEARGDRGEQLAVVGQNLCHLVGTQGQHLLGAEDGILLRVWVDGFLRDSMCCAIVSVHPVLGASRGIHVRRDLGMAGFEGDVLVLFLGRSARS